MCYGVNIDIENEKLLSINELIGSSGKDTVYSKIQSGEFTTRYGMVRSDEQFIDNEEALRNQQFFEDEFNYYYYYLEENAIDVILTGFSRGGGNYFDLNVEYKWE